MDRTRAPRDRRRVLYGRVQSTEPQKDRDPQTASRYEIACGNLNMQALMYGQGTTVSGDFLGDPNDFVTALGPCRS